MILWICPNGSMGLQIFVSADPAYRPERGSVHGYVQNGVGERLGR